MIKAIILFTNIFSQIPGSQRDEHNCVLDGGYQWCEYTNSCLRPWETPCLPTLDTVDFCPNSNVQMCRMACSEPECPTNQCAMRVDNCCEYICSSNKLLDSCETCPPVPPCPMTAILPNCQITDATVDHCGCTTGCPTIDCSSHNIVEEGDSCGGFRMISSICEDGLECVNTMGPMVADAPGTCMPICDTIRDQWGNCVDEGCNSWYDGCNTCDINNNNLENCSENICVDKGVPGCKDIPNNCEIDQPSCDIYTYVCPKITEITTCSLGGINGYTTYQLSIQLKPDKDIYNIYALFGDTNSNMILPPSKNIINIFGSNIGGVSNDIITINPDSRFDSWLTIGVLNGNINNELNTIGIPFDEWNEYNELNITNGAVFLMNPNKFTNVEKDIVLGQFTIKTGTRQRLLLNLRGKFNNYLVNDISHSSWIETLDIVLNTNLNDIPNNCAVWYDGCNTCEINDGVIGLCSLMYCITKNEPYCKSFHNGPLNIGDICYRYCEDLSQSYINRREDCPDGSSCISNMVSFDFCGDRVLRCIPHNGH